MVERKVWLWERVDGSNDYVAMQGTSVRNKPFCQDTRSLATYTNFLLLCYYIKTK